MRLLIIGAGSIGMRHLRNLLDMGHACLVYEPNETRMAALAGGLGGRFHGQVTPAQLLEQRPDAVLVCSPWDTHLPYAQEAVSRHVPLFVEKPLGTLAEIPQWRELIAQAERQRLVTQIGYQCRFHPKMWTLRQLVPQPTYGWFECYCNMAAWPGQSYGHPLLEASHDLDLALWCGMPSNDVELTRVEDITRLSSTCCEWTVSLQVNSRNYYRRWHVDGNTASAATWFHSPDELGAEMYRLELEHFLSCVREGRQTDVPLSDGLRVLEVVQRAEELARVQA